MAAEAQFLSVKLMPQRSTFNLAVGNAAIHHWGVHRPETLSAEVRSHGFSACLCADHYLNLPFNQPRIVNLYCSLAHPTKQYGFHSPVSEGKA